MSELSHTCSALGSLAADNDAKERRQKLSEFAVVQIPTAQREDRYPMIWRAWLRLTAGALLLPIGIYATPGDTDAIAAPAEPVQTSSLSTPTVISPRKTLAACVSNCEQKENSCIHG